MSGPTPPSDQPSDAEDLDPRPVDEAQSAEDAAGESDDSERSDRDPTDLDDTAAENSAPDSSGDDDTGHADTGADVSSSPQTPEGSESSAGADAPAVGTRPDRSDRPDLARRRSDDSEDGKGRRRGLLIAGIAAALAAVLAIGITVFALRARTPEAAPGDTTSPSVGASSPGALLSTAKLMTTTQAKLIESKQTWKVVADQQGQSVETSTAACLTPQSVDDEPQPQQLLSRTLTGSGKNAPVVLHQARAFGSPEEATQAYALMAKALGECDLADSYLQSGSVITGLGDQSTGVVVNDEAKKQLRTVLVSRTGRALNVVDVVTAADDGDAPLKGAVDALSKITDTQCTDAVGLCASLVEVRPGPPPVAGDQPGFLAVADIPRPQTGTGTWAGLAPAKPDNLVTSGCENVDFGKTDATSATSRSYLLSDKPKGMPAAFGIDEAVFTMADEKAAQKFADQLTKNISSCKDRQLTATVEDPTSVSGAGAGQVEVKGQTFGVEQKVSDTSTSTFRLGVVTAGAKVVYLFLPTEDRWDLTDAQWKDLTVRAGARATQVS